MIWDRRRESGPLEPKLPPRDLFAELLEHAPVMALLLDGENRVVGANEAARDFFEIEQSRLPASLVEVTLESRLFDVVRLDQPQAEAQLVHHRATVLTQLVAGRREGEKLLFLTDITELRRLSTVRQEFVANLVHELKTPITSLRLTAEGDIETGAMALDVSEFDLGELVHDSVARLGADRIVNTSISPTELVISTDRPKLAQALGNLLDNAAKFSPPATAIDVNTEITNDEVVLSVRDRGPGISPEHWSRVFERFYKVDRARPREAGGFGLGLAITKHLVQVLGGRIWTATARDGGQVFYIALPHQVLTGA